MSGGVGLVWIWGGGGGGVINPKCEPLLITSLFIESAIVIGSVVTVVKKVQGDWEPGMYQNLCGNSMVAGVKRGEVLIFILRAFTIPIIRGSTIITII